MALLLREVEELRQENHEAHVVIHGLDNQSGLLGRIRALETKVETELKYTKLVYVLVTVILMPVFGVIVSKLWPSFFKHD